MKLWILEARRDLPNDDNPWEPSYDKYSGFVIRAESESNARHIAQAGGADEVQDNLGKRKRPVWLEDRYSTCQELTADGDEYMLLAG